MYTNTLVKNQRDFENYDNIWIPVNDKYYMKRPAPNYYAIITRQNH